MADERYLSRLSKHGLKTLVHGRFRAEQCYQDFLRHSWRPRGQDMLPKHAREQGRIESLQGSVSVHGVFHGRTWPSIASGDVFGGLSPIMAPVNLSSKP
jgi:hypothetical protein